MKVRKIRQNGEEWVSINDLRTALWDAGLLMDAAAMLKVAHVKHHNDAMEAVQKCIAYFITQATGALAHLEN